MYTCKALFGTGTSDSSDTALYIVDNVFMDYITPVNFGMPVGEGPPAAAVPAPVTPALLVGVGLVVDQVTVAAPLLVRPLPLQGSPHGAVLLLALAGVRSLQRIPLSFFKCCTNVSKRGVRERFVPRLRELVSGGGIQAKAITLTPLTVTVG